MIPGTYNFTIYQGATFSRSFYFASNIGLMLDEDSAASIVVDATAKTFTRDDDGSWLDDGLQVGDYLVNGLLENRENNGSHIITAVTDKVITCAGSTLVSETARYTTHGAAFVRKAFDFTDYTGAGQIRKKYSDTTAAATFTVVFSPIRVNGLVTLSLADTVTSAIPAGQTVDSAASQYVYDFEIAKDSVKGRAMKGRISIDPEATKNV